MAMAVTTTTKSLRLRSMMLILHDPDVSEVASRYLLDPLVLRRHRRLHRRQPLARRVQACRTGIRAQPVAHTGSAGSRHLWNR
jgi:hypothetical protein